MPVDNNPSFYFSNSTVNGASAPQVAQNNYQTSENPQLNSAQADAFIKQENKEENKTYKGNKIYNTIQGVFAPGTIQFKNKEYKKGTAFMGGYFGSIAVALGSFAAIFKAKNKAAGIAGLTGTALGLIGAITTQILSAKDANKNTADKTQK